MGLKILHTSDWHLGAQLQGVSRHEEQVRFLDWLIAHLEANPVDALVIAGDIFDSAQASAEAQRLYYSFLAKASAIDLGAVLIIGGNHDSPSRLDAPKELLGALDVHVIGGMSTQQHTWIKSLYPIEREGQVVGVVAQVPFIHEYRLGVRTAELSAAEIRDEIEERFIEMYSYLAKVAELNWPGVPLMTTGHLTCELSYGVAQDDAPMEVHMVGNIGGLNARIFDGRFDYVALGHLHRKLQVMKSRAWYSGTPIAYSRKESRTPRYVLDVEVNAGKPPLIQEVRVPTFRPIHEVEGAFDDVIAEIKTIEWEPEQLQPLVFTKFLVEHFEPDLKQRLYEALDPEGPRVIEIQQERLGEYHPQEMIHPLRSLSPEEVFERLCDYKEHPLDDALRHAFRALVAMSDEEVDTMIKDLRA